MLNPVVDINIAVYNHAPYLRQTLEGALSQKTDFEFRLLIGDDFSTDGSREILKEYELKYPEVIKVIYQNKNLGFKSSDTNGLIIFRNSTAKYIAFLDGDDYWMDINKLQKQVDILEKNKSFVACSSNVFERTGDDLAFVENKKDIISFSDLALGNDLHTSSVLFRNVIQIPEWYTKCAMGDWIIWLLLTKNGSIYNFKEPMAVYRMHSNGIWIGRGKENNLKDLIAAYHILIENFPAENKEELKAGAGLYYNKLLSHLSEQRSWQIFYWTYQSFKFDFKLDRIRYVLKYFNNFLGNKLKFQTR